MKFSPIVAIISAIAFMVVGFLVGNSTAINQNPELIDQAPIQTSQNISMAVEGATPQLTQIDESLSANGVIHPKSVAEISSKTQGVIDQVLVDIGDTVKTGQTLAILDDSTMNDSVIQARADVEIAKANLDKAQADLDRVLPLLDIDAISRQQVDAYRTTLAQAKASYIISQAHLSTAQKTLKDTQIKAPISGVISAKTAQVGMSATGSLFSIIKNGKLEWQATINPHLAEKLRAGMTAQIAVGNELITGQVSHLSPTVDQSREIIVHVDLPHHAMLKAGMYQTGKFILSQSSVPAVPISAILTTDGYDYVWSLIPKDRSKGLYQVVRTKVNVLGYDGDKVATDLPSDALIVAKSAGFLVENDIVSVATINGNSPKSYSHQTSQRQ